MGVMMQAFYWDCPKHENKEFQWWPHIKSKVESLSQVGFTALWLPPASKGANIGGMSMGYDPYDYYDLGEFDQKDSVKTWFGSKQELTDLIEEAHKNSLELYADIVINHNNGADSQEINPIINKQVWTKFEPKSGKFTRNWECFHPSMYKRCDENVFGNDPDNAMPDLCHKNPKVYAEILEYCRWLIEEIGFDGFRYDYVKGYGTWIVNSIQEYRYKHKSNVFGVGECFDGDEQIIGDWMNDVNGGCDNPIRAFDFPLRFRLKDLCDTYGFKLSELANPGVLVHDKPEFAVTFVDNHDVDRSSPIKNENDKILAYAFILTHEGYPCVYWYDYYFLGLAREGSKNGIAALVEAHEKFAGGKTQILYADDNLYIMQRGGYGSQTGLILIINNLGNKWNGTNVKTKWVNTKFVSVAFGSNNYASEPEEKVTDEDGTGDFWAPPRGYSVYVPV